MKKLITLIILTCSLTVFGRGVWGYRTELNTNNMTTVDTVAYGWVCHHCKGTSVLNGFTCPHCINGIQGGPKKPQGQLHITKVIGL